MNWNYRIMKHEGESDKDNWYGLHEVFYDSDGAIMGRTEDSVIEACGSVFELEEALKIMLQDVQKSKHDILDYNMKPEAGGF